MMGFLLVLSIIGIVTSTVYTLMVAVGALRLAQRRRGLLPSSFIPPVSLLKPLHGSEPDLESHLQSFFEQDYPEFEIIFCARSDQDAGLEIARRVAARYPKIRSRFLCSGNRSLCQRQGLVSGAHAECRGTPVFRGKRQ